MRVAVTFLLFFALDPVWGSLQGVALQQSADTLDTTSLYQSAASVLMSRLRLKALPSREARVVCPPDRVVSSNGTSCVCRPNMAEIDSVCRKCPVGAETVGDVREGWGSCKCSPGHTGVVTHELSQCTPCDIDTYGLQGECHACPPFSFTNGTIGQTSCMCAADMYTSNTQCVPCPPNTIAPFGSTHISHCTCRPAHVRDLGPNGTIACVPANDTSRSPLRRLLVDNVLVQSMLNYHVVAPCPANSSVCVQANQARLCVRWVQILVSSFVMTLGTVYRFRAKSQCINDRILGVMMTGWLSVVDLVQDILAPPLNVMPVNIAAALLAVGGLMYDWTLTFHNNINDRTLAPFEGSLVFADSGAVPTLSVVQGQCVTNGPNFPQETSALYVAMRMFESQPLACDVVSVSGFEVADKTADKDSTVATGTVVTDTNKTPIAVQSQTKVYPMLSFSAAIGVLLLLMLLLPVAAGVLMIYGFTSDNATLKTMATALAGGSAVVNFGLWVWVARLDWFAVLAVVVMLLECVVVFVFPSYGLLPILTVVYLSLVSPPLLVVALLGRMGKCDGVVAKVIVPILPIILTAVSNVYIAN